MNPKDPEREFHQSQRGLPDIARKLAIDITWLLGIHLVILCMMYVMGGIDQGDIRLFAAFTVFLFPGWCLAPRIVSATSGLDTRYAVAGLLAFVFHVWIAWPASRLGLSFDHYYIVFALLIVGALTVRFRDVSKYGSVRYRLRPGQVVLCLGMLALICGAYRVPHSNDIYQFLMQQIDMAHSRSMTPSAIGMTAFGIDQPMPRWNTNSYHVWFSLMGDVTNLPVEGITRRWGTVPIAVLALLMLCMCVRRYAGRKTAMWVVVLAVFGPAVLWFRTYNAFVYGMRVTNNLCLDKDFALFCLIPAWLWFAHGCLKSSDQKSWLMLVLLIPLCIAIHPMTSVYLCMLVPFAVVNAAPCSRGGLARTAIVGLLALGTFLFVYTSGEAQAYHEQIAQLIRHDADATKVTGRGVHHWAGFYGAISETDIELDTTEWRGSGDSKMLRLRPKLLWTGSALLSLNAACVVWGLVLFLRKRTTSEDVRRWLSIVLAVVILLLLFACSSMFLSARPHLIGGYERLHWFAFVPALVSVAGAVAAVASLASAHVSRRRLAVAATLLLFVHLAAQGWQVAHGHPTWLSKTPMIHSVYDIYSPHQPQKDELALQRFSIDDGTVPQRPAFLRDDDRVLILKSLGHTAYWELRQAIWWPDVYGEANALAVYGDEFVTDWQLYYDAVDWIDDPLVDKWISEQGVTVIVDEREGAERYINALGLRLRRTANRVSPTAWRLTDPEVRQD